MGETFRKALELAESTSKSVSEASRDIASEIEKASKVIEDGIRSVEELAEQGAKLNENLQRTIIDLQKDFHDVRDESEKIINHTRTEILHNVDNIKVNVDEVLDKTPSETSSRTELIKATMLQSFQELKTEIEEKVTHLLQILNRALQNAQRLVEMAIDSAVLLKTSSEKTLVEAQAKVEKEFNEMAKVAQELSKNFTRDFCAIADVTSQETAKVLDQIKTTIENSQSASSAKLLLKKNTDDIKSKLEKSVDSCKSNVSKSINRIQKQSEKVLEECRKTSEKTAEEARKSLE